MRKFALLRGTSFVETQTAYGDEQSAMNSEQLIIINVPRTINNELVQSKLNDYAKQTQFTECSNERN